MDDDKSITEKLTDVITKATDSVKSTMSHIVDTASQAAQHAMESNAERISGQTAADLDPGQIGTQAYASDAAAMPAPIFVQPAREKKPKSRTKLSSGKTSPTPQTAASKRSAGKKAAKKSAKKSMPGKSNKPSRKAAKKSKGKSAVKKAAKKSARETKKRSKR